MSHAVIIGATGAIGGATAEALADAYELTLVGRDAARLRERRAALDARALATDVGDELEVAALFRDLPPIDVLVYAAGAVRPEPLTELQGEHLREVMDANFTGVALVLKHALPKCADDARVFVIGARPELVTFRSFAGYAAAKAAVAALLQVAALEARSRVAFTLVLPKAVRSAFWEPVGAPPKGALEPAEVATAIREALAREPEAELRVGS